MNHSTTTDATIVNQSKRAFLTTTALIAPVVAIAGCASIASLVTPANVAAVQAVMGKIQALMPYFSGISIIVGAVVPGVSSAIQLVQSGLTAAIAVFNTMAATMTVAAAQPPVHQIAVYLGGAMKAARQAVEGLPASARATANAALDEAQTVLNDLTTFVNPTAVAAAFRVTVPVHLFVKASP